MTAWIEKLIFVLLLESSKLVLSFLPTATAFVCTNTNRNNHHHPQLPLTDPFNPSISADHDRLIRKRDLSLEYVAELPFAFASTRNDNPTLRRWQTPVIRAGLQLYIASMCVALFVSLMPQKLIYKAKLVRKKRKEIMALSTAQFCSRWLLRLIPFCRLTVLPCQSTKPEPSIWVCNHISMLDIFILMGVDDKLRGRSKRPIKIVYWKGLEDNFITCLLFKMAGFIPVQMANNGNGNDNEYDVSSFKQLLKNAKEAFADGFDIGLLPEGQLNPSPESGLLPVFSGAFTLAKLSKRPIHMMALYGTNHLWHPHRGMCCDGRIVKVQAYHPGRRYESAKSFIDAFTTVVGQFGATGKDLPDDELRRWLTNSVPASTGSTAKA